MTHRRPAAKGVQPGFFRGTCYDMVEMLPASLSFDRLRKRLPLLQNLAGGGKVSPAVLARALPTIRADLATLADPKQTGKLAAPQKTQIEKLIAEIRAAVAKIEELLTAGTTMGKR